MPLLLMQNDSKTKFLKSPSCCAFFLSSYILKNQMSGFYFLHTMQPFPSQVPSKSWPSRWIRQRQGPTCEYLTRALVACWSPAFKKLKLLSSVDLFIMAITFFTWSLNSSQVRFPGSGTLCCFLNFLYSLLADQQLKMRQNFFVRRQRPMMNITNSPANVEETIRAIRRIFLNSSVGMVYQLCSSWRPCLRCPTMRGMTMSEASSIFLILPVIVIYFRS